MEYFRIIGTSAAIFGGIILALAIPPKYTKRVIGWIAVAAAISALGMYGYGYSYLYLQDPENNYIPISVLRTVFDSCRIFVGANNWDKISSAYTNYPQWEIYFWVIHLLTMAISASAVIVSLGSRLLKRIRLWMLRMRNITLIYGLNEKTLEFGRILAETDRTSILFIDPSEQPRLSTSVEQMGALFRADPEALSGSVKFLKSIGLKKGKRKLNVYALENSMIANHQFARKLLISLEARGVFPEQTSLTILSANEETNNPMQACAEHYGYGSLISINEPEMVARMLIRSHHPCYSLRFDKDGKAETDFHGVIIGFGQIGQAVLRQLVMNGQFQGSEGRISVFSPDYDQRMGWICHECRDMLSHYNISLFPYDGRSRQLYDYLEEHAASINYVAICAGGESANSEIRERLQPFLMRHNCDAPILMCSSEGVSHLSAGDHIVSHRIYTPEILCSGQLDRMAKVVNQYYQNQGNLEENWKQCPYFDRMSSRAAADFHNALLYCAGVTKEEALRNWNPQGMLLENLAATEHLRWNAFHYCIGFRPMTEQEFQTRAATYLEEKAKDPATTYRITKDMENRIHACMIPWEELDAYSQKENAITGQHKDYAENDRNNIHALADVLRAAEQKA